MIETNERKLIKYEVAKLIWHEKIKWSVSRHNFISRVMLRRQRPNYWRWQKKAELRPLPIMLFKTKEPVKKRCVLVKGDLHWCRSKVTSISPDQRQKSILIIKSLLGIDWKWWQQCVWWRQWWVRSKNLQR